MRIISGAARGTKLNTLDGTSTRPTLDRVKEPLFSILQNNLQDAMVLDLFSGSGALGLEAISRGSKFAVLCDKNIEAIKVINSNVSKTRFENNTKIINMDFMKCLQELAKEKIQFDLIFLDPPYDSEYASQATKEILNQKLLLPNGIIIIETDDLRREENLLDNLNINIIDKRKYGKVNLVFLSRKG
jgi:16S rRNA (guanine(966)-N(2))-methyltransferase RsmD